MSLITFYIPAQKLDKRTSGIVDVSHGIYTIVGTKGNGAIGYLEEWGALISGGLGAVGGDEGGGGIEEVAALIIAIAMG